MLLFLFGALTYLVMAYASYSETLKLSKWYFPIGIITAIVANLLWFSLAKAEADPQALLVKGLVWDAIIMVAYLAIPFFMFDMKLQPLQYLGLAMAVVGIFLTKVG